LHLRKRLLLWLSLAATTNQHDNMTTILASKADFAKNRGFYRGVTLHAATGNVYQLIESYTNGAATLELIGFLQDVPEWMFDALLADDRARCTL
jgi:hypothetical protein